MESPRAAITAVSFSSRFAPLVVAVAFVAVATAAAAAAADAVVLAELLVVLDEQVAGLHGDLGVHRARVLDVALHGLLREFALDGGLGVAVDVHDEAGDLLVHFGVHFVDDDEEEVETRHDGRGHLQVLAQRLGAVVAATDGVRSGQNRRAGVESSVQTCFGYADRLLLHGLVDRDLVLLIHLVKLIDAANAIIRQHQRPGFDAELAGLVILTNARCKSRRGRGTTRGVHGPRHEPGGVLEELTLGAGGITDHAHVDVPAQRDPLLGLLVDAAKNLEQHAGLDMQMPGDRGRDGRHEFLVEPRRGFHRVDLLPLLGREALQHGSAGIKLLAVVVDLRARGEAIPRAHVAGEEHRAVVQLADAKLALIRADDAVHADAAVAAALALVGLVADGGERACLGNDDEGAGEDAAVAGLCELDDVVADDDVHGARHGARGNFVGVFLDADLLPVDKDGLLRDEDPVGAVEAGGARLGLGVLELLLDVGVLGVAIPAGKKRGDQLGPHLRGPRHGRAKTRQRANLLALDLP
mmetsp:Transcript_11421/g.28919  ORF Transcript_11421/g.28919 Transcript_11421/m.28919 type:complete len:525 (-) Transcript_11421:282-1856(-)